ncbi:MAG: GGDEF domain-containing protein [Erysipelotrichaceae bacterium]|nr:GGDEF domain-containing protein [Erysipelotrichaceae bacterium]
MIIIRDISLSKKIAEQEKLFAYFDYLTGIYNRRAIMDNLQQEMARVKREKSVLCLMMIDIDHFKEVNDQLGHQCGDKVLQVFAKFLTINVRTYDVGGRYGGDEFIVCLPNTNINTAYLVADRLRIKIKDLDIKYNKKIIRITSSIGLVSFESDANDTIDTLISKVDKNMYFAKQKRDTVVF